MESEPQESVLIGKPKKVTVTFANELLHILDVSQPSKLRHSSSNRYSRSVSAKK